MNTKLVIIGLFGALVIGAGVFVATRDKPMATETAPATSTPPSPAADAASSKTPGQYVDYREGVLAQTSGQRVLFFHAPWCPQCRSIEKGIKADGVPDGFSIIDRKSVV